MTLSDEACTKPGTACPICGGEEFGPGPGGRMSRAGPPPCCLGCGSLERHRILRRVYDAMPEAILAGRRVLQFSNDRAAPRERFGGFEVSVYGHENSLDITDIDRPDASYDWVIANHVLEHVTEDRAALRELLRVAGPAGIVQVMVPTPATELATWDLAEPDPDPQGHVRGYGSDFPLVMASALDGAQGLCVVATDPSTGSWDVVYFFSRAPETVTALGKALLRAGLPTLRCA